MPSGAVCWLQTVPKYSSTLLDRVMNGPSEQLWQPHTSLRFFQLPMLLLSLELILCPNIFSSRLHLCVLPFRLRLCGYYSHAQVVPEVLTALWVLSREQEARKIPQAHQLGASCHLGNRSFTGHSFFLQHETSPLSVAEDATVLQPAGQAAQVDLDTLLSVFPDLILPTCAVSHIHTLLFCVPGGCHPAMTACLWLLKQKGPGETGRIPVPTETFIPQQFTMLNYCLARVI